ncbi:hypothetical protein BHE74_00048055 [Ensete ventricosum]|nr:hypothetical protein BHE74_00048055 [Ensete ventricosum]RZS00405.1 hypothetical protein BHM03_00030104 [Ensete ventricosum]
MGGRHHIAWELPLLVVALATRATPCGLVTGGRPLRPGHKRPNRPAHGWLPLRQAPLAVGGPTAFIGGCPCRGPWTQPTDPTDGQAVVGCSYMGLGRGQPPLHADNMQVAAPGSLMERMKNVKRPRL